MERKNSSIINIDILCAIENYIFENDALSFRMLGFTDDICLYGMRVPTSFEDPTTKAQLKKANFKSSYDLFNTFNRKAGLGEISETDIEESMAQGFEYWYMHINFKVPKGKPAKGILNNFSNTFLIVLYMSEGSAAKDSFEMLYSKDYFFDYVKCFSEAEYLDLENPLSEEKTQILSKLEIVLGGICKKIGIEIPEDQLPDKLESYLIQELKVKDFEELLSLLARGKISEDECKKKAKTLLAKAKKTQKKGNTAEDTFQFSLDVYTIVGEHNTTYYSDWKFDPEDIAYGISEMLGEEFTFKYPKETFSQDLFPYIQKELAKSNLEMMTFDTQGDSYEFILVAKDQVEKITSLSQKLRVEVERLG